MSDTTRVALLSVFDKTGIVEFARALINLGWRIIASGGTAKKLIEEGVEVQDVAILVGGGAILGHRVVTLSREIHAGLIGTRSEADLAELGKLGIPYIDLVCIDLYPLAEEITRPGSTRESVIEKTDIGGLTMLRSAAKGRRIVIADPADREVVLDWLKAGEPEREQIVTQLAAKAEGIVADYCLLSARYHSAGDIDGMIGTKVQQLRYGENPWQQQASLFSFGGDDPLALDKFELVVGTEPSYVNVTDVDRLLQTVTHIAAAYNLNYHTTPCIAVGGKHGNACGAAVGTEASTALQNMLTGDLQAIFGGCVMVNFPIDEALADVLLHYAIPVGQRRLLDSVVAPEFSSGALDKLGRKQGKCRVFQNPALGKLTAQSLDTADRFRYVRGGFLKQPNYTFILDLMDSRIERIPSTLIDQEGVLLAWAIGSTSNSNTITLVGRNWLIANAVGQQSRVEAARLAVHKAENAKHNMAGCIAYSDSFFPFVDGVEVLAQAGVNLIVASSGSVKDSEVREYCRAHNVSLCLIPDTVARGFSGH